MLSIKFLRVSLWHMSIGAGVVRTVTLQQIHHAPHAKASAEGNNQRLQSVDGRRKELHKLGAVGFLVLVALIRPAVFQLFSARREWACTRCSSSRIQSAFCNSFMRFSAVFMPSRIASAWSLTEERAASSSARVEMPCSGKIVDRRRNGFQFIGGVLPLPTLRILPALFSLNA